MKNIPANYQNKWIALSSDRANIVASGKTIKEVQKKLNSKDQDIIITYVLPFNSYYSPLCLR